MRNSRFIHFIHFYFFVQINPADLLIRYQYSLYFFENKYDNS